MLSVPPPSFPTPERQIYTNRTLNLRAIRAIGYDMDYTLIHYRVDEWERAAFSAARRLLRRQRVPTSQLRFRPEEYIQGLVLDLELGNVVKATRFGYVITAHHGTTPLDFGQIRAAYGAAVVDLHNPRFVFLNTLFSLSMTSLFAQLVDLVDRGQMPAGTGYSDVFRLVSSVLDEIHAAGKLKARIVADPERFVVSDPETAATLADQRLAGKKLLLVTNSEWAFTEPMMDFAIGRHLPGGDWRSLFDVVVTSASKPSFFTSEPAGFEVVDRKRGLLQPHSGRYERGAVYFGGSAKQAEASLGVSGDRILYVGDHLFGDVHASKHTFRWRTALIMRELEDEFAALAGSDSDTELGPLMARKDADTNRLAQASMEAVRVGAEGGDATEANRQVRRLRSRLRRDDEAITPLARAAAERGNPAWGLMMRSGSDKSLFARQVERHADIYTSRVSNLRERTPFAYFRAVRSVLPHEVSEA